MRIPFLVVSLLLPMLWTLKQSKNSILSASVSVLLFVFCLAGLPLVVSAQNSQVTVADATLEQFMSAFAQAFEGVHYVQTVPSLPIDSDTMFVVDADGNFVFFLNTPVDQNGQFYDDEVLGYDGIYVAESAYRTFEQAYWLRHFFDSSLFSNMVQRIDNLLAGYQDQSYPQLNVVLEDLRDTLLDFSYYYLGNRGFLIGDAAETVSAVFDPSFEDGALTGQYTVVEPTGGAAAPYEVNVHDPQLQTALEEGFEDLADTIENWVPPQAIYIDLASNVVDKLADATTIGISNFNAVLAPLPDLDLTGETNELSTVERDDYLSLTNSLLLVSNSVDAVTADIASSINLFSNDFLRLFDSILPDPGRSTVLTLSPSLMIESPHSNVAIPVAPIQVDLADERFTVGGWPLWQILRSACILVWWAAWVFFMWDFIRRWVHKYPALFGG